MYPPDDREMEYRATKATVAIVAIVGFLVLKGCGL